MAPLQKNADLLSQLFFDKKCWQIDELAGKLDYAVISVRRLLLQVGYHRSYTHNGRWYTLKDIPVFNVHGLWQHDEIGFSKRGTLTNTILHIIDSSRSGYPAGALCSMLATDCRAVLTQMYQKGRIDRIKPQAQFVYLSADKHINHRQRIICTASEDKVPPGSISAEAAVRVLVEFINNPSLSSVQISANLKNKMNMRVDSEQIKCLFEQHGLKKMPSDLKS
jgi:hypothetical protein